jgi:ABC-type Fe3+-siderophore transport system permease subunit
MKTRTDRTLLILTALFVGALAFVAGAISFAHMRELATHHDQLGWKSYAFPISVDGLEVVASLYLVAQRRTGRPTGWVPWVALIVGTAASLAANVAVGGADPIGKALAGWPALSMLVSVKLLFAMFDHESVDQRLSLIHIRRCRRYAVCRSRWSPYH